MALTPRQELCYNHTMDFYAPVRTYAVDGKPLPITYDEAHTQRGVRCRPEKRASPTTGFLAGRIELDVADSVDLIHVAEDQEVDDGWWLQDVTLRPDGTQASTYGRWWVVRGNPKRMIDSTRRRGGKRAITASQEAGPPLGLPL